MLQVKSPGFSMSSLITTGCFFCVFFYTYGVSSQTVTLNSSATASISNCSSGLISEQDNYIFQGIIDGTIFLSNLIQFQIKTSTSNIFSPLCTVSLLNCTFPNSRPCYCAEKVGNNYTIITNRTVTLSESEAQLRLQWANATGTNFVLSNILTISKVYDVNAVTSLLMVDNIASTCPMNITYSSLIKFQCQNSPSPCQITITLDYAVVASNDDVITYSVPTSVSTNASHVLVFSYSVCGGRATTVPCAINIAVYNDTTTESVPVTSTTATNAIYYGTTTDSVPVTSTTATDVTKSDGSLKFEPWGIALLVIFYIGIVVTVVTVIALLYFVIKFKTVSLVFKLCIGFLVFAEALCVILIIVFAEAKPTTNDPEPGSNILAQWKIMLIFYCVFQGVLLSAAIVVAIYYFNKSSSGHTVDNHGMPGSVDPIKPDAATIQYENVAKPAGHNSEGVNKAKGGNNRTTERGKDNASFEMKEEASNHYKEETKDASEDTREKSDVKKLKKRTSKKTPRANKEAKRSLPSPQINMSESDKSKEFIIHAQAPASTKLRPTSIENTSNPYIK